MGKFFLPQQKGNSQGKTKVYPEKKKKAPTNWIESQAKELFTQLKKMLSR